MTRSTLPSLLMSAVVRPRGPNPGERELGVLNPPVVLARKIDTVSAAEFAVAVSGRVSLLRSAAIRETGPVPVVSVFVRVNGPVAATRNTWTAPAVLLTTARSALASALKSLVVIILEEAPMLMT